MDHRACSLVHRTFSRLHGTCSLVHGACSMDIQTCSVGHRIDRKNCYMDTGTRSMGHRMDHRACSVYGSLYMFLRNLRLSKGLLPDPATPSGKYSTRCFYAGDPSSEEPTRPQGNYMFSSGPAKALCGPCIDGD